ncbi:MAG: hypothetical protein RLZZ242_622 [Bacteroidota bacterium]
MKLEDTSTSVRYQKLERQTRVLSVSLVIISLFVIVLALLYSFPELFRPELQQVEVVTVNESYNDELNALKAENQELKNIQDFYLARRLLESDTIYSVQTGMIPIESAGLLSPGLSNALIIEAKPYLKFSIGLYETFEEANALRRGLVKLGFTDAFVASYKGTTRLKIHRAE